MKVFAAFDVNLINYYCSSRRFYFAKLCDSCQIVKVSKVSNSIEVPTCPNCPANVLPKPETRFTVPISVEEREALVGAVSYSFVEYTEVAADSNFTMYNSTWNGNKSRQRPTGPKSSSIPGRTLTYQNSTQNSTTHTVPYGTGPTGKFDVDRATKATISFKAELKAITSLVAVVRMLEYSGGVEDSDETVFSDSASKITAHAAQPVGELGAVESSQPGSLRTNGYEPSSIDTSHSTGSEASQFPTGSNSEGAISSESGPAGASDDMLSSQDTTLSTNSEASAFSAGSNFLASANSNSGPPRVAEGKLSPQNTNLNTDSETSKSPTGYSVAASNSESSSSKAANDNFPSQDTNFSTKSEAKSPTENSISVANSESFPLEAADDKLSPQDTSLSTDSGASASSSGSNSVASANSDLEPSGAADDRLSRQDKSINIDSETSQSPKGSNSVASGKPESGLSGAADYKVSSHDASLNTDSEALEPPASSNSVATAQHEWDPLGAVADKVSSHDTSLSTGIEAPKYPAGSNSVTAANSQSDFGTADFSPPPQNPKFATKSETLAAPTKSGGEYWTTVSGTQFPPDSKPTASSTPTDEYEPGAVESKATPIAPSAGQSGSLVESKASSATESLLTVGLVAMAVAALLS